MAEKQCYIVLNIKSEKVVSSVEKDYLSTLVKYKDVLTISSFAQCDTLAEAKKIRRENGGVILKGVLGI